ncbi:MAG: ABC transporter ATP-binding protein [FCB group bacterium]|nr:ABC transporter ATP-binding protein [FCB group bacterium]
MFPYLRKYSHYFFQYKLHLIIGALTILLTNTFGAVKPMILKYAIDDLQKDIQWEKILYLAAAIIALAVIQGVFRFIMRRVVIGVSRKAEFGLRRDFIEHLQRLSLSYYDKNTTGDIMARGTSDIEAVRMVYGPGLMYSADTVVVTAFSLTMMFTLSWQLTLAALAIMPLVSVTVYFLGKKTFKFHQLVQEGYSSLNTFTQENIAGVRVVKAFALEDQHTGRFGLLAKEYLKRNMSLVKMQALFMPLLYFIFGLGILIVLWIGGVSIIEERITLGSFAAFASYLMMLSWPMIAVGWVVNIFQRGEASMERIDKIMTTQPEISNHPQAYTGKLNPVIEFRNLSFAYDERGEVLHNLNLKIPSGHTVGIVGATGSGKSTIVRLIPRIYNPPPDTLFIDSIPVERIDLMNLRNSIAFVPQDTFMFSDSIEANIACSDKIPPERIVQAAETAGFSRDVEAFPDKFKTMVGERGISLSGGQKQRASLARALLKDAPILILDDALSAVDASTEAEILQNLKRVFQDKTVIVVTHRVSTAAPMDMIIVMDNGAIVERGKHEELLSLEGIYYRLYRRQMLEKELETI